MSEGKVPRGVTVGGVDISGVDKSQAEQRLRNDLGERTRQPVTVLAGNMSTKLEPTHSGMQVDWGATVDQAGQQPLNPITRIRSFFETREVGIISKITDENLNRSLNRVERELTRDPQNAELSVNTEGKADIKEDKPGQTVDRELLSSEVRDNWLNTDGRVNVEATITPADADKDAAERAAKQYVVPATAKKLVFHGREKVDGVITPQNWHDILTFKVEGGEFMPQWNTEKVQEILGEQLSSTEVEYRDASFEFHGDDIEVVPSKDGVAIQWKETLGDFQAKALDKKKRDHQVLYEEKKAKYTTAQAKKAHFDDVVGTFTTGGFSGSSGTNIRRVAEMVDGAIVLPGETFSLNGHTGPRGTEQGFVESGIIIDGHAGKAVGGGISQFATTLYNASYFAGMEDVAHTPHSYYISRYPAGREATVYEGAIDLKFKNPFDTPVRIRTRVSDGDVTVELHGVKQVDVESIPGERTNPTSPEKIELDGDECSPSSGAPGFTTTDTRVVKDLKGKELSRETQRTVYDPQPIVTCR
ncbi:VanW family protein [uncultured Corynebacterium sp.]|uniref:VanW family protein n=1 Tax=uncultured Corynebacterium sp. TaxID=159447 RepID=UPI0025E297E5|nr:VanW family protein [uncultured Corynebacterium sp.]